MEPIIAPVDKELIKAETNPGQIYAGYSQGRK